jgi:hypothetical protein
LLGTSNWFILIVDANHKQQGACFIAKQNIVMLSLMPWQVATIVANSIVGHSMDKLKLARRNLG